MDWHVKWLHIKFTPPLCSIFVQPTTGDEGILSESDHGLIHLKLLLPAWNALATKEGGGKETVLQMGEPAILFSFVLFFSSGSKNDPKKLKFEKIRHIYAESIYVHFQIFSANFFSFCQKQLKIEKGKNLLKRKIWVGDFSFLMALPVL